MHAANAGALFTFFLKIKKNEMMHPLGWFSVYVGGFGGVHRLRNVFC
jgi:hypothetical protein